MKKDRLPPAVSRALGRAMHDYEMFASGDRIMVAVSGGVDSLVLSCLLTRWMAKAPIEVSLVFVHVDHGFWRQQGAPAPEISLGQPLAALGIPLEIYPEWELGEAERTCFQCARNRRSLLFDLARQKGINKLALGHHQDDLIETFMLNCIYSGNISTMVPHQRLFAGDLSIVRPMAYLGKHEVYQLAERFGLRPLKNLCPLSEDTRRERVRAMLTELYQNEPGARQSLFAALGNVRWDYLPLQQGNEATHPLDKGSQM